LGCNAQVESQVSEQKAELDALRQVVAERNTAIVDLKTCLEEQNQQLTAQRRQYERFTSDLLGLDTWKAQAAKGLAEITSLCCDRSRLASKEAGVVPSVDALREETAECVGRVLHALRTIVPCPVQLGLDVNWRNQWLGEEATGRDGPSWKELFLFHKDVFLGSAPLATDHVSTLSESERALLSGRLECSPTGFSRVVSNGSNGNVVSNGSNGNVVSNRSNGKLSWVRTEEGLSVLVGCCPGVDIGLLRVDLGILR
jgi:hypothetical protein